jgi:hypothetical protein
MVSGCYYDRAGDTCYGWAGGDCSVRMEANHLGMASWIRLIPLP